MIHLDEKKRMALVALIGQGRARSTRIEMGFNPLAIDESLVQQLENAARSYADAARLLRSETPLARNMTVLMLVPQADGSCETRTFNFPNCCCVDLAVEEALRNVAGGEEEIIQDCKVIAIFENIDENNVVQLDYKQPEVGGGCRRCVV